jgi:segregation and condensation protein B
MGKRPRRNDKPPDLGLDNFQQPPEDDPGLPLDELSRAYASLLDRGDDPYEEAPVTEPELAAEAAAGPGETEDAEWDEPEQSDHDAACPITPRSIFESMLFVGHPNNEPLTSEKVACLMRGVRPQEVDGLVVELNRAYEEEGCPYHIESAGPGYRLALREEFSSLRDKFYGRIRAAKLSQAAIEVLAIVAYRQPMTREEIDALRSRPCGALLNQLVRRQLLRIERPPDKPRVVQYHTTPRFLEFFGMEGLKDLPKSPDGSF